MKTGICILNVLLLYYELKGSYKTIAFIKCPYSNLYVIKKLEINMLNIIYKNTSIVLDIVKYIVHKNVTFCCIYLF